MTNYRKLLFLGWIGVFLSTFFPTTSSAETPKITFALISDTHIGNEGTITNASVAQQVARTINTIRRARNDGAEFVIIAGDLTEFGARSEYVELKKIVDAFPRGFVYPIMGNHDHAKDENGSDFLDIIGFNPYYIFSKEKRAPQKQVKAAFVQASMLQSIGDFRGASDPRPNISRDYLGFVQQCQNRFCFCHIPSSRPILLQQME
jgi:DNA repair exonuclease SbcCD nuclease subunit